MPVWDYHPCMGAAAQGMGGQLSEESEGLRLRSPIATGGLTTALELERTAGGRIYFKGYTYAAREVLDSAGAIWCPVVRKWFVRDLQLAEDIRWALRPGKGKPKRRLQSAPSALTQLRHKYRGIDIRCEICTHYQPGQSDTGSCPKGAAFQYGLCHDFDGGKN